MRRILRGEADFEAMYREISFACKSPPPLARASFHSSPVPQAGGYPMGRQHGTIHLVVQITRLEYELPGYERSRFMGLAMLLNI
jgi:hypothetical protein